MNISFNHQQFNKHFPYHILIDREGKIIALGDALNKMIKLPANALFFEYVTIIEPENKINTVSALTATAEQLFLIEINTAAIALTEPSIKAVVKAAAPVQLKGNFEILNELGQILFIGTVLY